jgi:hypothetical protein
VYHDDRWHRGWRVVGVSRGAADSDSVVPLPIL